MKKFKIIIAVIFAVAVIMGVSACSNSSNSGGGGSSSSDKPASGIFVNKLKLPQWLFAFIEFVIIDI